MSYFVLPYRQSVYHFSYSCLTLTRSITFWTLEYSNLYVDRPLCNFLFLKPKVLRALHTVGQTKKGFLLIRTEFSGLMIPESIVFYCKTMTGLTVYIENALNMERAYKRENIEVWKHGELNSGKQDSKYEPEELLFPSLITKSRL